MLLSRISKKLRCRTRKKGIRLWNPSAKMTVAEDLITRNWGIKFQYPDAVGKGQIRGDEILAAKRKANKKIPYFDRPPSRQVVRHQLRRAVKLKRQETTVKFTRRQRNVAA